MLPPEAKLIDGSWSRTAGSAKSLRKSGSSIRWLSASMNVRPSAYGMLVSPAGPHVWNARREITTPADTLAGMTVEVVGLDGDDTLWRNEEYFVDTQAAFRAMLAPYVNGDIDLDARLDANERANLELFGYGVKGFTLSLIETAIEVSGARITAGEIQRVLDLGKEMLKRPVELIPGVAETVPLLAERYRLIVVTKGDLWNQEQKLARSGLAELMWRVEIVAEKDEATYSRIMRTHNIDPADVRDGRQFGALRRAPRAGRRRPCRAHPAGAVVGPRGRRARRLGAHAGAAIHRAAGLARRQLTSRPQSLRSCTEVTRWSSALCRMSAARARVGRMFSFRFLPLMPCQMPGPR